MTRIANRNDRMFAMFERAKVLKFAAQWKAEQGYEPAPFQKAIAMQRLERGQTNREIIDALVAMRVS
jgi:hypothetical protein